MVELVAVVGDSSSMGSKSAKNARDSAQLLGWWRWAIIGITVVSAVFTPSGDPLSMLALAIPLVFFYFAAILVGKICHR